MYCVGYDVNTKQHKRGETVCEWGQIKTRELSIYLSVNSSPKEFGKERGSIQHVRIESAVMEYDVNNTQGIIYI